MLAFAQMLRDKLEKHRQIPRGDDAQRRHLHPARRARALCPRAQGAALFISIHADCHPAQRRRGRGRHRLHAVGNASDAEAARLAEAENKADVIAGVDLTAEPDDVANILIDLAQRETKTFSLQFARTLVGELKADGAAAQEPAQVGRLQGARRAGRALGAGRTRLHVDQGRSQAADLGRLAAHAPRTRWRRRSIRYFAPRLAGARGGEPIDDG